MDYFTLHVLLAEYLVNMFVLQTITNESKSHLVFYKYLMLKLAKLYSLANFSIKYLMLFNNLFDYTFLHW